MKYPLIDVIRGWGGSVREWATHWGSNLKERVPIKANLILAAKLKTEKEERLQEERRLTERYENLIQSYLKNEDRLISLKDRLDEAENELSLRIFRVILSRDKSQDSKGGGTL